MEEHEFEWMIKETFWFHANMDQREEESAILSKAGKIQDVACFLLWWY